MTVTLNQKVTEQKPFLAYVHKFRAIAIFFIVIVHCHDILDWKHSASVGKSLYAFLSRSTIFFVFIGGFLFQHLSARFNFTNYLRSKLQNVLLPYVFMSVPILIFRVSLQEHTSFILEQHSTFGDWPAYQQILYYFVTGSHLIPYWFIPMICIFYLLAPVLVRLDEGEKIYYGLPLFILLSLAVERYYLNDTLRMFVHFFSVYLLGMFFSHYRNEIFALTNKHRKLLIFLTVAVLLLSIALFTKKYSEQILYIQKLLFCWVILYALWKYNKSVPDWIGILAEMSFGIYFIHYYFLFFLKYFLELQNKAAYLQGTIFNLAGLVILTFMFSVAMLYIVKKALGNTSRYLIGY